MATTSATKSGLQRAQVHLYQQQHWVAGLRWEEKKTGGRRIVLPARQRQGKVAGLPLHLTFKRTQKGAVGEANTQRVVAQGQVESRYRRHPLYALAVAFSLAGSENSYGVYRLTETQYVFLANVAGMPSVMADVVGTLAHIEDALALFSAFNSAPEAGWHILSPLDAPVFWDTLVSDLSVRARQAARLSRWSSEQLMTLLAGVGVLALGYVGLQFWGALDEAGEPVLPIPAVIAPVISPPPPAVVLPHPWASMPTVDDFLSRCQSWRDPIPVTLDNWRLGRGRCEPRGLELVYLRQPGGTAAGFSARALEVFGRTPVFNLTEGGNEGVMVIPWPALAGQDEAVAPAAEQLMRMVSWFQARQVALTLREVKADAVLPGNDGTPPPVQDWREYGFSVSDKHMPEALFAGLDAHGIRLSNVAYTLDAQGQFTYEITGQLYAKE